MENWLLKKDFTLEIVSKISDIKNYDILIIGSPQKAFSKGEISAITQFVSNGGSLLIMNEWDDDSDDYEGNSLALNELCRNLGFIFQGYYQDNTVASPKKNLKNYNNLKDSKLEIVSASGKSNAELKKLLAADPETVYALEGKYVIIHFPSEYWKKLKYPKELIDNMDLIYEKFLEVIQRKNKIYRDKLWFITDPFTDPDVGLYQMYSHCAFSLDAVSDIVEAVNESKENWLADGAWGVGHEIGHAVVELACAGLFQPEYTSESWNNLAFMLVLKKLGYYDEYKENKIYSEDGFNPSAVPGGFDKNQLPKNLDVLRDNDWVFVSLLVKIVDKYGSESMSDFLAKAASDAKNGMRLGSDDERAQYNGSEPEYGIWI